MPPRVLMLGWEFPPFITGGLGTACFGLTKALDRAGVQVTFVLPRPIPPESSSHVELITPGRLPLRSEGPPAAPAPAPNPAKSPTESNPPRGVSTETWWQELESARIGPLAERFRHTKFLPLPESFISAYTSTAAPTPSGVWERIVAEGGLSISRLQSIARSGGLGGTEGFEGSPEDRLDLTLVEMLPEAGPPERRRSAYGPMAADYSGDLVAEADRYARFCVDAAQDVEFDVIHAHDWLTYPAGLTLSRMTGKPLVVHVHATEFDRSGEHVNQAVYNIERRGMHGAARVITVSMLTRNIAVNRYGVNPAKIDVVYNGVDLEPSAAGLQPIGQRDKIVLYFGRITHQKGPEYFLAAAKRVLELVEDVKFVVAGSGDLAASMIQRAAEMGIGHKVLFTGFLRGKDIARVFAIADLYVMPSVSEPFGIAPLEALSHNVPVLISKSSGVSEVLVNALKVDFWDVDDMANKIIAVLRHPPLSRTLVEHGQFEVRGITWDGAATKCVQTYEAAIGDRSK
ncbi:MAG: glycosyltransferase [Phycisphaerales bacterium]